MSNKRLLKIFLLKIEQTLRNVYFKNINPTKNKNL